MPTPGAGPTRHRIFSLEFRANPACSQPPRPSRARIASAIANVVRRLARNSPALIQKQIDSILVDFDSNERRIRPAV
jgi:hypothetical protein